MGKLCLNVIEENCGIVKEMSQKETLKEKITWNVEDDRNVGMIKIRNIRFLNLKSGRMNVGIKVNALEQFCERKGDERKLEKEC